MPRIPVIDAPSVQASAVPAFREGYDQSRPDSGLSGLAKGLGQFGADMSEIGRQEKAKADAARALQGVAGFTREADAVLLDPTMDPGTNKPKGYKYLQGEDAFGARDAFAEKVQQLREQHRANLANDDQRRAFDAQTISKVTGYLGEINAHAGNQAEQAQSKAYKIDREVELGHAAAFADNPELRTGAIQNIRRVALSEGARMGLPATETAKLADVAESDANATALNALILRGNTREAENFYAAVKGRLGDHTAKIEHGMKELQAQTEVEAKAGAIVQASRVPGYPWIDAAKALEAVDKLEAPPEVKARTRQLVEHQVTKAEQLRDQAGKAKLTEAISIFESSGNMQDPRLVPVRAWLLDPANGSAELWQRFERGVRAELRANRTSSTEWRRLQMEANKLAMADFLALSPREQADTNIKARYFGQADETTQLKIQRIQNGAKKVVTGGGLAKAEETSRFAKKQGQDAGLRDADLTDFEAYMADWIVTYRDQHDGQEPTRKEMRDAVADGLLYGERDRSQGFLQPNRWKYQADQKGEKFAPFPADDQRSDLNKGAQPAPAAPKLQEVGTTVIPEADREQIISTLKKRGKPVDEASILNRYRLMQERRAAQ